MGLAEPRLRNPIPRAPGLCVNQTAPLTLALALSESAEGEGVGAVPLAPGGEWDWEGREGAEGHRAPGPSDHARPGCVM